MKQNLGKTSLRKVLAMWKQPCKKSSSSPRTRVSYMLSPCSPASNTDVAFLCSLHFSPVLSQFCFSVPLTLQPRISPLVPCTAVGICKPANLHFVRTCCKSDGFHLASQETRAYNIIDTNKLTEELWPLPKIKDNHNELKVMLERTVQRNTGK